jgi:hypothetical protein
MANFNLNDYVQVNDRIMKFYEKYTDGSIQTELLKWENGVVVMKAYAYRNPDDPRPATGHAYEKEDATYINKTSALENCETSAVGRALAMLGFEIKKSIASREEVGNAVEQQKQLETKPPTSNQGKPTNTNGQTPQQLPASGQNNGSKTGTETNGQSAEQTIYCDECTLAIVDEKPKNVKAYSERYWGRCLCKDCQKKVPKKAS